MARPRKNNIVAPTMRKPKAVSAMAPATFEEAQPQSAERSVSPAKLTRIRPVPAQVLLAVVVVALMALSGITYAKYRAAQDQIKKLSNPQAAAQSEVDQLVKKVSEIVELPAGETPTIATVVDASKLSSQAFFAHAVNGDKVLMYTTAKKAYLYRPSTAKIIELAPINVGEPQATPAPAPTKSTTKP